MRSLPQKRSRVHAAFSSCGAPLSMVWAPVRLLLLVTYVPALALHLTHLLGG